MKTLPRWALSGLAGRAPWALAVWPALGLALLGGAPLAAQLSSPSPRTLGLGGNTTATARRLEAMSTNPAGLAMPGQGGFSLALLPLAVRETLGPLTLADVNAYAGKLVPHEVKEDWLGRIEAEGGQKGSFGVEVTELAFTAWRLGFQVSTLVAGELNLAPDIAQVALFGNAGRTGSPEDLSLSGSEAKAYAVSTLAASYAHPFALGDGTTMALGLTLKHSLGHALAVGREQGGVLQSDPIRVQLEFPMVALDEDDPTPVMGSGTGLDVGVQVRRGRLQVGAVVLNLLNTFAWDETKLVYRPGKALLEEDVSETDFEKQPYGQAPAAVRALVDDLTFGPVVAVGGAWELRPDLRLLGDLRHRTGEGMGVGPKSQAGVGVEYRGLGPLELRAGAAAVSDGFQLSGGLGLHLIPVGLSVAGAMIRGKGPDGNVAQVALVWGGR